MATCNLVEGVTGRNFNSSNSKYRASSKYPSGYYFEGFDNFLFRAFAMTMKKTSLPVFSEYAGTRNEVLTFVYSFHYYMEQSVVDRPRQI